MVVSGGVSFGDLLRQYRRAAGLTQEELADKAQVSPRAISDLERGLRNRPWRDTVQLLAAALNLTPAERAALEAAARRVGPTAELSAPAPDVGPAPHRTNLPIPATSFIGRERETAEVRERLGTTRLLTLTGTGGCGKTRLALEVASHVGPSYSDGVWFVDLAPIHVPEQVGATVAAVLNVREGPDQSLHETLLSHLRARSLLLVLDNCEHLVASCAILAAAILRTCPKVHLLATSREPLHIDGEASWRVPSLSVPPADQPLDAERLLASEAGRLFVERALTAQPAFKVNDSTARYIGLLCSRLDGIPLAIELAATRVTVLTIEQIVERLDQRFRLLTGGSRAALPRQQTLAATVSWSYDLLSRAEQRLFHRLAVFPGSFTLEAAEAVGGQWPADDPRLGNPRLPWHPQLDPRLRWQRRSTQTNDVAEPTSASSSPAEHSLDLDVGEVAVLDLLTGLVEKSLVVAELSDDGTIRYRLLETLRQYASERLQADVDVETIRQRHANYFSWFVAELVRQLGPTQSEGAYLGGYARELNNIRAALGWYLRSPNAEMGIPLIIMSHDFFWMVGPGTEGLGWLREYMPVVERPTVPLIARTVVQRSAAWFTLRVGDPVAARRMMERAVDLCRKSNEEVPTLLCLFLLGWILLDLKELPAAEAALVECLPLAKKHQALSEIDRSLIMLGDLGRLRGDYIGARACYDEMLGHGRRFFTPWANRNLAFVDMHEGDLVRAQMHLRAALTEYFEEQNRLGLVECLAASTALALARGEKDRSAWLAGAVESGLEEVGGVLYFGDRFEHEQTLAKLRTALPGERLAAEMASGRSLALDQAVASTRQWLSREE